MHSNINSRRPHAVNKLVSKEEVGELVRRMRGERTELNDYRSKSLKLHGLICAKCGREFDQKSQNLLTVHHKDGNHNNNPKDGSNWENLCAYCHVDEHSRGILANYLQEK
jgi:5-methylcytosine-specific restriction endonuclease McrA